MPISNKDKLNIALTGAAVAVGLFAGSPVLVGLIGGVSQNWLADLSWRGWEAARDRWLTPDGRLRHEPLALASRRALHKTVSAFVQEAAYRQLPAAQQQWCRAGIKDWETMLLGRGEDVVVNPQQIIYGRAGEALAAAKAVADLRRALLDTLFHDPPPAFAEFLQRQLTAEQLALRFTAELQQDQAARDAYQQLLLENVARQANALLVEQHSATAELQATLAAMQEWQAKSPQKQQAKFAKLLTKEANKLFQRVKEEGQNTRSHSSNEHTKTRQQMIEIGEEIVKILLVQWGRIQLDYVLGTSEPFNYDARRVADFINSVLEDSELDKFCKDFYPEVHKSFSVEFKMRKRDKINSLIFYYRNDLGDLIKIVLAHVPSTKSSELSPGAIIEKPPYLLSSPSLLPALSLRDMFTELKEWKIIHNDTQPLIDSIDSVLRQIDRYRTYLDNSRLKEAADDWRVRCVPKLKSTINRWNFQRAYTPDLNDFYSFVIGLDTITRHLMGADEIDSSITWLLDLRQLLWIILEISDKKIMLLVEKIATKMEI